MRLTRAARILFAAGSVAGNGGGLDRMRKQLTRSAALTCIGIKRHRIKKPYHFNS